MNLTGKIALNTALLVIARVLVVIGGILSVAFASRYLGLDEYGALTTAFAFVALFEVFTDFGISTIATREIAQRPEDERHIVGNVLSVSLVVSVGVVLLTVLLGQVIYPGGGVNEDIRLGIAIMAVQIVAAAPIGAARAHFVANQRAYLAAAGEATGAVVTVTVTALAVVLEWGFAGVAAGLASGRVAQVFVMVALMQRGVRGAVGSEVAYWKTLLKLALPLGATLIVNYLYFRLDVLLLGWLKGPDDVAIYGLAYKVIEAFIVLPSYFMITLFPEIARMAGDSDRLRNIIGQAHAVMEALAFPVVILTIALAEPIVTIIGGDEFEDAANVLRLLMFGLAVSFVNGVYGNALVALGKQAKMFWLSLIVLGFNIAANLVAIPLWGVNGAAAAVSLSEVVGFIVIYRLYLQTARRPEVTRRGRRVLAALAMAVSVAWAPFVDWPPAMVVAVAGVVGSAVYGGALLLVRGTPEAIETQLIGPLVARFRST